MSGLVHPSRAKRHHGRSLVARSGRRPALALVGALLLAALLYDGSAGCTPPPTPYDPPAPKEREEEREDAARLGPGDVFDLRVFGQEELSGTHRVSPRGTILVPLIGSVSVVGLMPPEVAGLVAERLRDGYLREPHVTVFVQEYNSKRFFVLGAVAKPGSFAYQENMTIVEAIAIAGGFKDLANPDGTVVTRVIDDVERRYVVPVESISRGETPNFVLHPGDIVFVPERIL